MSFVRIAAALGAALLLSSGAAGAAGPLRAFKVGLWSGGAYTDERSGGFTHCSAGVAYDSGVNLFVLVTAGDRWWFGFINPHWSLTPNKRSPIELRLDGGAPVARFATVPSSQLVLVPLPDNSRLLDSFRRSSQLGLTAEGRSFSFALSDTSAVVDRLAACVQIAAGLEARGRPSSPDAAGPAPSAGAAPAAPTPAAPAASPAAIETPPAIETPATFENRPASAPRTPPPDASAPAPVSAPVAPTTDAMRLASAPSTAPAAGAVAPAFAPLPQAARLQPTAMPADVEEVRLARDFLVTAGLPNARLVVTDKPSALASFTAVWRSDGDAGAVKIIPPGAEVSGIGIASDLIAVDPRMCKGNFASARSMANIDGKAVFSAALSCTKADEQRTTQYFIAPRGKGGFVVFAIIESGSADGSAAANRQRIELLSKAAARAAADEG